MKTLTLKKALIFNPYLDSLGGGERYSLQFAEYLLQRDYEVILAWDDKSIIKLIKQRLNINLERVEISPKIFTLLKNRNNLLEKIKETSRFNLIFFVSDGSIPFLFGQKNLLHFQVPFKGVNGRSLINQLKLKFIHQVICNSLFTKKLIDEEFNINARVIYPALNQGFSPGIKSNIILSVGRFDKTLPAKKQDILIKAFKGLIDEFHLEGWKLILVGGALRDDFIDDLKKLSQGYPIEIYKNISFEKLKMFYNQAKIYWHAAGFGEDLELHPERAEHFGISVIEAMAAGCLPIVFNGGGLSEIVKDKENGFLFNNLSELKQLTIKTIKDRSIRETIAKKAQTRGTDFSLEKFYQQINEIIS